MFPVSQAYLDAQNKVCRDSSQMEIEFSVLDFKLENNANIISYSAVTPWSKPEGILRKTATSKQFATFEENYIRADGKQFIYDFDGTAPYPLTNYAGFESAWISDSNSSLLNGSSYPEISISLGDVTNLDVISLYFDIFNSGDYVAFFTVTGYNGANIVGQKSFNNDKKICVADNLGFTNIDSITVEFKKMNRPNVRCRVWQFNFGYIFNYTNNELLRVSIYNEIDPTSSKLPDQHITFEIDNQNHMFNPENPDSLSEYLKQGQQIKPRIGIETTEGIKWIPLGIYYLSEWSTKRDRAEFKGISKIDTFNHRNENLNNFYINKLIEQDGNYNYWFSTFLQDGYSLFELLTEITEDDNIFIDGENELICHYPISKELTKREIIQLVAQAMGFGIFTNKDNQINIFSYRNDNELFLDSVYKFDFNNSDIPQLFLTPKIKQIVVKIYKYVIDNINSELWSTDVSSNTNITTEVVLNNLFVDGLAEISFVGGGSSGATDFDYNTKTVTTKNIVMNQGKIAYVGKNVNIIEDEFIYDMSADGDVLIIDNPFCTSKEIAKTIVNNYRYWYQHRFKYNISNRGEPALDCGDKVEVETEFNNEISGSILNNSFEWETGAINNATTEVKVGGA